MEAPKPLSADDILGVDDLEIVEVQVPEWKGSVHLRVLPADVGLALNDKMQELPKEKQSDAMFILLAACLVSPDGKPLFSTPEQADRLRGRSAKVLMRLQKKALELQGWSAEPPAKND